MSTTQNVMMPLVKIKDKFQVTIPNIIRERIHLQIGSLLEVAIKGDMIMFKPKIVVDREEEAINEGLVDYRAGRIYGPFKNVDELEASAKKFKKNR